MDHESMKIKLFELLDGELGREEADQVAKHLEICPNCRIEAQEWKSARQTFRSGFAFSVPMGFSDRVMRKIREREVFTLKPLRSFLLDFISLPRWEVLAASATFFVVLSYFMIHSAHVSKIGSENPITLVYNSQGPEQTLILRKEIDKESLFQMAFDGMNGEESETGEDLL